MYDNVEVRGSDQKGAVAQAIIFAAYLASLTILAILAVNIWYVVLIAVVGLPATGIHKTIAGYLEEMRWERNAAKQEAADQAIKVERITNDAGLPIIEL